MQFERHAYRVGPHERWGLSEDELGETTLLRKQIEPWLSSVFQSEHLSLLLGSGFATAIAALLDGPTADMGVTAWECECGEAIAAYAAASAAQCDRGTANVEDQLRSAMRLQEGLEVISDARAGSIKGEIDRQLRRLMSMVLTMERSIAEAEDENRELAEALLVSFLLSFASRTASRERLCLFTTNYDRLIEHGCDLAGLRPLDRFVGALAPAFRASRLNIDMHYNPPGIRGEPRYLEGVIKLCKLHGSVDWRWERGELRRCALPFGASDDHPAIPTTPYESVVVYPSAAKDVETSDYPYAELFRDFSSAICRPNSALVTYGYGFGDDHVNRIIRDMLRIPSTHLVIIAWDQTDPEDAQSERNGSRLRITRFLRNVGRQPQISLLLGSHFGDLKTLTANYLPKPAIDPITIRRARLEEVRGEVAGGTDRGDAQHEQAN